MLAAILNYCKIDIKKTAANSRFAKAGALRFYENLEIYSNFVHLIKFGFENPRLRKAHHVMGKAKNDNLNMKN